MKFEEIYAHMAEEYKTLAGVEPEDAADVSIRLRYWRASCIRCCARRNR